METLWQDLKYGVRQLARSPGFTAVAVLTLALGIGANTAIFSFADALLLRPLPVRQPDRVVALFHVGIKNPENYSSFSFPDYLDFRDQNRTLSGLAAYSSLSLTLGGSGQTARVEGQLVSGNYFSVLGVKPALGRAFLPEEDRTPGTHPVVVISHGLWQRRFGADPGVCGQMLTLNGHRFTIVGVAPENFRGLEVYSLPDLWVPLMMHAEAMPSFRAFGTELFGNRGTHWLELAGRLKPGLDRRGAEADLKAIAQQQEQDFPDTNRGWSVMLVPADVARFGSPTGGAVVHLTELLLAVVGLVLLIACANVANLLLTKAVTRRREMGIRLALGAARGRLVRQLITESVMLSLLGGAGGLLLAAWTASMLTALEVSTFLPALDIRLDARVLGFALVLSVLTGGLFGLAPAIYASAVGVVQALKDAGLAVRARSAKLSLRQVLVTFQVALCLILLVGAGLLLATLRNLQGINWGFEIENLALMTIELNPQEYSPAQGAVFYEQLVERVRALPEVRSASLAATAPFGAGRMANDVFREGGSTSAAQERFNVDVNIVGRDYFRTMGIPLVRGRDFALQDRKGSPGVAVVNETMAAYLWPRENPLGKRLRLWNPNGPGQLLEVIGVVKDGRYYRSWRDRARRFMFLPLSQHNRLQMALQVRSAGPGESVLAEVNHAVQALDKNVQVIQFKKVNEAMAASIGLERMGAKLLSGFGLLAMALAAVGVYGMVSFSVSQRRHEIGIRMALGARPRNILHWAVKRSAVPIFVGVALGWAGAFGLTRLMASLLYGIRPTDPLIFALVSGVLMAVGLLASWLPARRATRVDPLVALRYE